MTKHNEISQYFDNLFKMHSRDIQAAVRHDWEPRLVAIIGEIIPQCREYIRAELDAWRLDAKENRLPELGRVRGLLAISDRQYEKAGSLLLDMAADIHNRVVDLYDGFNGIDEPGRKLCACDKAAEHLACLDALHPSLNRATVELAKRLHSTIARHGDKPGLTSMLAKDLGWYQSRLKTIAVTICHQTARRARVEAMMSFE